MISVAVAVDMSSVTPAQIWACVVLAATGTAFLVARFLWNTR